RSTRAVVALVRAPEREERLLHDVLGRRARTDHAVREREGDARMAVVEDLERARLAAADELHELLVGERGQRGGWRAAKRHLGILNARRARADQRTRWRASLKTSRR